MTAINQYIHWNRSGTTSALSIRSHSVAQWPSPVVHSPCLSQVPSLFSQPHHCHTSCSLWQPRFPLCCTLWVITLFSMLCFLFSEPELTAVSHTPSLAAATPNFTVYPAANMFWWAALPCESTPLSAHADFPISSGLNSPHPSHITFVAHTPLTRCPYMFTTQVPVSLSSALSLSPTLYANQFYALQQLCFFCLCSTSSVQW